MCVFFFKRRDVGGQLLIFMSSSRAMALYEACGKALKIYADQHIGTVRYGCATEQPLAQTLPFLRHDDKVYWMSFGDVGREISRNYQVQGF